MYYPSLKGKLILVTGATSGIGKGVCEELLKQEALVIGIGRDKTKIKDNLLNDDNFYFFAFDLVLLDEIEALFNDIVKNKGKFDGLVLCAGKEETIPINSYKVNKIKTIYDINVFAGIEALRVFSKKKNSNDKASAIFISSVMGELGQPGKLGYCSTKSAILGIVKSASLELAKRKITVNAVSPGIVETPMTNNLFEAMAQDNVNKIKEMHPLGMGKIENITPIILFLLSKQSQWITGQNIKVDGGYSVQ